MYVFKVLSYKYRENIDNDLVVRQKYRAQEYLSMYRKQLPSEEQLFVSE